MTDQQALELIEKLSGDDFCEDMNCRLNMPERGPETGCETGQARCWDPAADPNLREAVDKLVAIYKIAHAFVASNSCYGSHDDWRAEAELRYARDVLGKT
jgi:hypothetical protein